MIVVFSHLSRSRLLAPLFSPIFPKKSILVRGAVGGVVANGVNNKLDNNSFFYNAPTAMVLGGVTSGISGNVAEHIVPPGVGRPASGLDWTLDLNSLGVNSLIDLQRHTIDEGINNFLNIPLDITQQNNKYLNKR